MVKAEHRGVNCVLVQFQGLFHKTSKKKIMCHVAMQKVDAKKWNYLKELFQKYTKKKIFMKTLRLLETEQIHFLINKIGNRSLGLSYLSQIQFR